MTAVAPVTTPLSAAGRPSAPDPALAEAARGFEQIFLRQMIGAMRAGSLGDALFGSQAEDQFRDLMDTRLAENLAEQDGGLGIGAMLIAQLERGRQR
jgi:flagellar protein FlgJ